MTSLVEVPVELDESPVAGLAHDYRDAVGALAAAEQRLAAAQEQFQSALEDDAARLKLALATRKADPGTPAEDAAREEIRLAEREIVGRTALVHEAHDALVAALAGEPGEQWVAQTTEALGQAEGRVEKAITKLAAEVDKAAAAAEAPRGVHASAIAAVEAARAGELRLPAVRPVPAAADHPEALRVLGFWPNVPPQAPPEPVPVDTGFAHALANDATTNRRLPALREAIADVTGNDPGVLAHFTAAHAAVKELTQEEAITIHAGLRRGGGSWITTEIHRA